MDPYAKPKERNIGARRPKIRHVSQSVEPRTRRERQAEKQGVAAERRAIKKAARRHLKEQLLRELDERLRILHNNRCSRFAAAKRAAHRAATTGEPLMSDDTVR